MVSSNIDYTDGGAIRFLCDLGSETLLADGTPDKRVKALYYKGKQETFKHWMGEFTLNDDVFQNFVANNKKKCVGRELYVNYDHEYGATGSKAAGWITNMEVEGNDLLLSVDWTPSGELALQNKEYKYFSAEFMLGQYKSADGKLFNDVFTGGALTNKPFMRKAQVNLSDEGEGEVMDKEQMLAELKLSHKLDVIQLQADNVQLLADNTKLSTDVKELSTQIETIKLDAAEAAKKVEEDKVDVLLNDLISKGKSTQVLNDSMYKTHFLSIGSEKALEVAKLMPVIVKLSQEGHGEKPADNPTADKYVELDNKVKAYMLEKNVDYSTALDEIEKQGKETK